MSFIGGLINLIHFLILCPTLMMMLTLVAELWLSRSHLQVISGKLSPSYQNQKPSFLAVEDLFNLGNGSKDARKHDLIWFQYTIAKFNPLWCWFIDGYRSLTDHNLISTD
jgi:hypothetical protein